MEGLALAVEVEVMVELNPVLLALLEDLINLSIVLVPLSDLGFCKREIRVWSLI